MSEEYQDASEMVDRLIKKYEEQTIATFFQETRAEGEADQTDYVK